MKKLTRALALALAFLFTAAVAMPAMAAVEAGNISLGAINSQVDDGEGSFYVRLTNNHTLPEDIVTLTGVEDISSSPIFGACTLRGVTSVDPSSYIDVYFDAPLESDAVPGTHVVSFRFTFEGGAVKTANASVTVPAPSASDPEYGDVTVAVGVATLTATHVYIPVTVTNGTSGNIALTGVVENDGKTDSSLSVTSRLGNITITGNKAVAPGLSSEILLLAPLENIEYATHLISLKFSFDNGMERSANATITIVDPGFGSGGDATVDSEPAFRLSSYDENKALVPTPSGDAGDRVAVRIPLLCTKGTVSEITITPIVSTSVEEFPFNVDKLDYTLTYPSSVREGQILEFRYSDLRLSKMATSGVKKVDFRITYVKNWSTNETVAMTVSVFVNVKEGYVGESPDVPGTVSTPKIILESYGLSAEKIYAGEGFDLTFTLRNTSSEEAVRNIQLTVGATAEAGKLMPADGGSNSIYIDKIGMGETHTETISLQCAPDIEAKAYTLELGLSYEGAKNIVAYEDSAEIVLNIAQKIRLKFDDPQVSDQAVVGQPVGVYFAMYNLGRAPIYNVMITVEGDGLEMSESSFTGSVAAGGTMSADFDVFTNTPGAIDGFIVITYEDSSEEQMEERLPLSLFVSEPFIDEPIGDDPYVDPTTDVIGGKPAGGFPWLYVAIGALVIGAVVAAVIIIKKRRERQLEDV